MALKGLKVVEMAGLAPAPLAGMILADFGASVVRVDKPNQPALDTLTRNKKSIAINLKESFGQKVIRDLITKADVLIDPYRPGVMEKLGLGPSTFLTSNPRLIFARLTGFGQSGPLSQRAGHDINYLATSGILSMLGRKDDKPFAPINLLADFAGGSFTCIMGILVALFERERSGKGQVVDASMVDGCAYLGSFLLSSRSFLFPEKRGENMLDGGAHFYDTYKTSDGKYMSVGAIEPQFYKALLDGLGIGSEELPSQMDQSQWDELREKFAAIFATKTRNEWTEIFKNADACVEPVLELDEAVEHPHNKYCKTFHLSEHGWESMPAPKLARTPAIPGSFSRPDIGEHTIEVLKEIGYNEENIRQLLDNNTVHQCEIKGKL